MFENQASHFSGHQPTSRWEEPHLLDCHYVEERLGSWNTPSELDEYYRKSNRENQILACVGNAGQGVRQGLVSRFFGSKGDISLMGRALKQIALGTAARFSRLLPPHHWLVYAPADLVAYWNTDPGWMAARKVATADIVTLAIPDQETMLDPPLPSIFAARRGCLQTLESETARLLQHCGISHCQFSPSSKAVWWAFLIRPAVLSSAQWMVASGSREFSKDIWGRVWTRAQEVSKKLEMASIALDVVSTNANTNLDLYLLYQRMAGASGFDDMRRLRRLFGVPEGEAIIDSQVSDDVIVSPTSLVHACSIRTSHGIPLKLGAGVVLDNCELRISGSFGTTCAIPDGTVMAHCCVAGELRGAASNGCLIGVESTSGIRFVTGATQTTFFPREGERRIAVVPFDRLPGESETAPGLCGMTFDQALANAAPGYHGPTLRFALEDGNGLGGQHWTLA